MDDNLYEAADIGTPAYDASADIGVAVDEDVSPRAKKKKKKKRKRSISQDSSEQAGPAGISGNNNVDASLQLNDGSRSKKKKKKKKRKSNESTNNITNSASLMPSTKSKGLNLQPLTGNFVKERSNLPVYQYRNELCSLIKENEVVLVVAETVSLCCSLLCFSM